MCVCVFVCVVQVKCLCKVFRTESLCYLNYNVLHILLIIIMKQRIVKFFCEYKFLLVYFKSSDHEFYLDICILNIFLIKI